jgi:hypothetical protein
MSKTARHAVVFCVILGSVIMLGSAAGAGPPVGRGAQSSSDPLQCTAVLLNNTAATWEARNLDGGPSSFESPYPVIPPATQNVAVSSGAKDCFVRVSYEDRQRHAAWSATEVFTIGQNPVLDCQNCFIADIRQTSSSISATFNIQIVPRR